MLVWTEQTWAKCGVSSADGVLVALSGGADSAALLLGLFELLKDGRIARLCAAHLHHGIRGADADADEAFSHGLCESLGVPFYAQRADIPAIAASEGISVELAARNARYAFLRRTKNALGLDVIALGHHRDDQAETLLLHLLRGAGTDGLAGMRVRSGDLIRPLLYTDKADILAYLDAKGQPYCTDATNFSTDVTRNKIRLTVLPAMETVNPSAKRALSEAAARVAEDADYLNRLTDHALEDCGTDRQKLAALDRPIRLRVIRRLLPYTDFTSDDLLRLDALLTQGQNGDAATLKYGVVARLDAGSLRFDAPDPEPYCVSLPETGSARLPHGVLSVERVDRAEIPCGGNDAYADADRIRGAVFVRSPEDGDRFTPLGMHGSKLLSDCYTDRKVARDRRGPVVCDENGIVFVAGYTIDERLRVTAQTVHIVHYHYEED